MSFWWTMGVNQSHEGVRTAQAIINLALMTGNIGRPGTGANSITGQCNAMGSRLFSNTTNLLGGHDFTNAEHRDEGRRHPRHRRGAHSRPSRAGPTTRSSRASCAARSRACGSSPPTPRTRGSTRPTLRDVLGPARLPRRAGHVHDDRDRAARRPRAARRRLGREGGHVHQLRAAHRPDQEGRARARARRSPTSRSSSSIAEAWGCGEMFARWTIARGGVPDPEGALARPAVRHHRHRRLRACSSERGGIQWPLPEGDGVDAARERRLFADGRFYHADGRARSSSRSRAPMPEPTDATYPVRAAHRPRQLEPVAHADAHGASRPCCASSTRDEPYVEINPTDARSARHRARTSASSSSRSAARMRARAFVTHTVQPRPGVHARCTTRRRTS